MIHKVIAKSLASFRLMRKKKPNREAVLRYLLNKAQHTRFGKQYRFDKILESDQLYQSYRERLPICDYDDWVGWLGARGPGHEGAQPLVDQAWPGEVNMFCMSSGTTTGRTKYIPYSREMANVNRKAALDFFAGIVRACPGTAPPFGKTLYMSGSTNVGYNEAGALCADMSALTKFLAPRFLDWMTLPSRRIASLEPWSDRLEALTDLCLGNKGITTLSGIPIWQCALLERIAEKSGKLPYESMPNLKVLIHGGMSIVPYKARLQELMGPNGVFCEIYAASETGITAYQLPGDEGMRFEEGYQVFYEFEDEAGQILTADQVKPNVSYSLIVTTCSGLWRYRIGDRIQFKSTDPLMADYVSRDKTTSAFDEKVTEKQLETAMSTMHPTFADFSLGPYVKQQRHVWFVLSQTRPDKHWLRVLDDHLRQLNQDYDDYRGDGRIEAPMLVMIPDRHEFLQSLGRDEGGQRKFPRLLSPPEVEQMLDLYGEQTKTIQF
jgi:hypothetical protein